MDTLSFLSPICWLRTEALIVVCTYVRACLPPIQAAVQDLEALRDTSPDESNVIFQLAKVYRLMGDSVKSAQMLAVARDVSPKSVNKIRKLLETVKDTEAASDVMDEG